MLGPLASIAVAGFLLAAPAAAQETEDLERVVLRVTSARGGVAVVDRGSIDGLLPGDRVRFLPREGGVYEGRVLELEERTATIELLDLSFVPSPGTRGEAWVPRERLAALEEPESEAAPPPAPAPTAVEPEHPPWKNQDEDWREGEPLLARLEPMRPESRPRRISGRYLAIADQVWSSEDDRSDGFYRAGVDVLYENVTGNADSLHFDGEANYRNTDVPDQDDQRESRLRLDRLSYSWGGNRFSPQRFEIGRFLHDGMSEFGVVDGIEWNVRENDGDRFGVSAGFLPEPDLDHDTGSDFEVSGYYRWVFDESEQFSLASGYQKTFHNGDADRDLVVGKLVYFPRDSWSFHGTTWIDLYTEGDDDKPFIELTQAYLDGGRDWDNGASFHASFSHLAFPQMDRDEFLPVTDDQLADDHSERLALDGRVQKTRDSGLSAGVGGWVDEDDHGGDAELGFDVQNFAFARGILDVDSFVSKGLYTTSVGGRVSLGARTELGHWDVGYEFAQHRFEGFSSNNDDLPQHRVRASQECHFSSGWSLSGYVESQFWDDEQAFAVGFYLQKSF